MDMQNFTLKASQRVSSPRNEDLDKLKKLQGMIFDWQVADDFDKRSDGFPTTEGKVSPYEENNNQIPWAYFPERNLLQHELNQINSVPDQPEKSRKRKARKQSKEHYDSVTPELLAEVKNLSRGQQAMLEMIETMQVTPQKSQESPEILLQNVLGPLKMQVNRLEFLLEKQNGQLGQLQQQQEKLLKLHQNHGQLLELQIKLLVQQRSSGQSQMQQVNGPPQVQRHSWIQEWDRLKGSTQLQG